MTRWFLFSGYTGEFFVGYFSETRDGAIQLFCQDVSIAVDEFQEYSWVIKPMSEVVGKWALEVARACKDYGGAWRFNAHSWGFRLDSNGEEVDYDQAQENIENLRLTQA